MLCVVCMCVCECVCTLGVYVCVSVGGVVRWVGGYDHGCCDVVILIRIHIICNI